MDESRLDGFPTQDLPADRRWITFGIGSLVLSLACGLIVPNGAAWWLFLTFPTEGPCEKSLFLLKRLARLQNHEDPRASVEKPFANRPTTAQSARTAQSAQILLH